jgi:DUF4097 and DUF4098 domain-containing protein YvlB
MRILGSSTLILLFFSGCHLARFNHQRIEKQEIETSPLNAIDLTTFNGNVEVVPADSSVVTMEITYKAYGSSPEQAEQNCLELGCEVEADDGKLIIKATKPPEQWMGSAAFSMQVPRDCKLELKTSNGRITATGFPNGVVARSSNGRIHLVDIGSEIRAKTSNGTIKAEHCTGELDLDTSNGKVYFAGVLFGESNRISTSNGRVEISLPSDAATEIAARTSNGSIECVIPTQRVMEQGKRSFRALVGDGTSGEGESLLNVRTSNGSIKFLPLEDYVPESASEPTESSQAEIDSEITI